MLGVGNRWGDANAGGQGAEPNARRGLSGGPVRVPMPSPNARPRCLLRAAGRPGAAGLLLTEPLRRSLPSRLASGVLTRDSLLGRRSAQWLNLPLTRTTPNLHLTTYPLTHSLTHLAMAIAMAMAIDLGRAGPSRIALSATREGSLPLKWSACGSATGHTVIGTHTQSHAHSHSHPSWLACRCASAARS
jgi:hypothetical protein